MSFRQSSTVMRAMMCSVEGFVLLEPVDQVLVAFELNRQPQPLRPHDAYQVGHCDIEIPIDNNIVELLDMGDLLACGEEPALDYLGAVLTTALQPPAQRFGRRCRMNIPTASGINPRTCCAPCQSISSRMSLPSPRRALIQA